MPWGSVSYGRPELFGDACINLGVSLVEHVVLGESPSSIVADAFDKKQAPMTFEEFYNNEHAGQVRRCYVMTRSAEDASDIVHEAMIEVYRKWSTIDRPGAYLNRAVLNRCRNRAQHTKVSDRSMRLVSSATKTDRVDDVAESVAIDRILARLPFNQRAALVLRFYGGATTDEIADALGCRPGSVGPWINRGLAALRKELR